MLLPRLLAQYLVGLWICRLVGGVVTNVLLNGHHSEQAKDKANTVEALLGKQKVSVPQANGE